MAFPFIHDNFLLASEDAVRLYHEFAADEPIIDYHCHLPPEDLATDRRFSNLSELWLAGDHYKWRAMRANGVPERLCTGDASPRDKFEAWARTVPHTLRNPLFHWSHLELKRYFGIDELLDEASAERVWETANEAIAGDDFSVWGILERFDIRALCTTDDPGDDLSHHASIAEANARGRLTTRVYPTFRPDGIQLVDRPQEFNAWVDRLATAADAEVSSLEGFVEALDRRHKAFHDIGCRLSDHGLSTCYADFCSEDEAGRIFGSPARGGRSAQPRRPGFAAT